MLRFGKTLIPFVFFALSFLSASFVMAAAAASVPLPGKANPAIEAIQASLGKDNPDKAIEVAEAAVEKDPNNSDLVLWLGRSYGMKALSASVFTKLSWAKKCKKSFEKAVELDPNSVEARLELMGYHLQAPGVAGGDKAEAARQADELLKRNPPWGHMARGRVFQNEKKLDLAETEYRAAVKAGPGEDRFLYVLSGFLAGQKRYKEAAEPWEERYKGNPADMVARYQLARVALISGTNLPQAVEHLTAYLTVEPKKDTPTWADAQWRLGLVYEKLGQKDNAVKALQQALKLDPGHQRAQKDLERLRKA